VLARLFILYDRTGLDEVNYREYLVGVTPVLRGSLEEKIRLAMRMCDVKDTQMLSREDLELVLRTMNKTLGFLADPVSNHVV
jgi:Ca2+-binding EF-hand superfamily protein